VGKLENLLKRAVGDPDVVVAVDAKAVRFDEAVLPPGREQFTGSAVETEDGGGSDGMSFVCGPGIFRAVKNEDVVMGVDSDAGDLAEDHAVGENGPSMYHEIRRLFSGLLRKTNRSERKK